MIVQVVSAVVILAIAIAFLDPGPLTMPESAQSMLILAFLISFLVFSAYLFKERSQDEREEIHKLKAGRLSYLVGVGATVVGIIVQALEHELDPWLVYILCAMIFSKIVSRIYSHFRM